MRPGFSERRKSLRLRPHRTRARAPKPPAEPDDNGAAHIARIERIAAAARTTWFSQIGYLAFVGVTLLAVQDADVFLPERQTQLPLVGVSIPTDRFFAIAPLLGAALYVYLHVFLTQLWDAAAAAPAEADKRHLSDHLTPWIVTDFALAHREDRALRAGPLTLLTWWVTLFLIFLAGPAVQLGFWWRSMPAHDEALTLFWCGAPLLVCLYTGWVSWRHLRGMNAERRWRPVLGRWSAAAGWTAAALAVTAVGWFRTEGTLEDYARRTGYYDWVLNREMAKLAEMPELEFMEQFDVSHSENEIEAVAKGKIAEKWWMRNYLAPAQLQAVTFVDLPPEWFDRGAFAVAFRQEWCRARGIEPLICRNAVGSGLGGDDFLGNSAARQVVERAARALGEDWCAKKLANKPSSAGVACKDYLAHLSWIQEIDLIDARKRAVETLPQRDMSRLDLRNANLDAARLDRTILHETRLEGSALSGARLEGASLFLARLNGAFLREAHFEGAEINSTWLGGAFLLDARFTGAYLKDVYFDEATTIQGADFTGAGLWSVDLSRVPFWPEQINRAFGDASVTLPVGVVRPSHWAATVLNREDFQRQWRQWQATIGYAPPPGPTPEPLLH